MGIGVITTKYGKISGEELTGQYAGITTFRSVPYAQPPVGALRFCDPVDPEPWEGVLDCSHFASRPMQETGSGLSMEPWASDFYYLGNPQMSEDCLYLHITTGAQSAGEKRPVFLWFHGGGLATGYYSELEFDPSEMARRGIVVVSVGQRLNVFGYLSLRQLSDEQGCVSGNYGLKDQVKALDWVRENIALFGGDPDCITVGGQSGGCRKSTSLATSPKAAGKVRRCINQSNLAWLGDYQTPEQADEAGRAYLANLGLDPDITPDELRRIPAFRFYSLQNRPAFGAPGGIPGSIVCDGVYVANVSAAKNMDEYGAQVDYLSGGNVGEGSLRGFSLIPGAGFDSAESFYAFMREKLGDLYDRHDFRQLWPVTDDNAEYMSRVLASRAFSGGLGVGGVIGNRYFGAYRAGHAPGARTFSYVFGHYPPSRPEEKGTFRDKDNLLAWHSCELWYTFASLREGMPACRPWEAVDFRLADVICSYWVNFIRTGDPNGLGSDGSQLPHWPESRENYGWMLFTDRPEGHDGLDKLDEIGLEYLLRSGDYPRI